MNDTVNSEPMPDSEISDPWDDLFRAHGRFLNDLDCIHEMFRLVSPVLQREDEARNERIKQLGTEFERDGKRGREISSIDEVREFAEHMRKMKTADRMFRQNVIVAIVSKFDEFLMVLLRRSFEENTSWLKNPDKAVSYKRLLEIDSLDDFVADLIRKEVDQLMRGSHHGQIALLDSKLKLGIEDNFDRWCDFLEITERRNLFVHCGGLVNSIYLENAGKFGYETPKVKQLSASDEYVSTAIDIFYELSVRLVHGVARRLYTACFIEADRFLNNVSVDLLSEERWDLAERVFAYALGIPDQLRADAEIPLFNLVNLCIARKFAGKDIAEQLKTVNWAPLHPKYQFAVAILEDRFEDASGLMRSEAVRETVDKDELISWPLLREFRKSESFQNAFRDMFGHEYKADLLAKAKQEIEEQQLDEGGELTEEDFKRAYPWDYQELTRQLTLRYSDFKANDVYHAVRKPLLGNPKYAMRRYLDPGNPRSQTKDYYSERVLDVFDKHYSIIKNGD